MTTKVTEERYTPMGCALWAWRPFPHLRFRDIAPESKVLWLQLYTDPSAKRSVTGLWPGTLNGMSDVSGLSQNATYTALGDLVEKKLVQWDADNWLARLTTLPDALDRAHNAQAISGWWTRFKTLPACALRDSHVPLLWWMVQQGKCEPMMLARWKMTFGTITIPTQMTPFQPPGSSDTSTVVQPSLFGPRNSIINKNSYTGPPPVDGPSMAPPTTGGPDPDPDLDLDLRSGSGGAGVDDAGGRPRLQLVPSLTPEESAAVERARNAREMREAVRDAGGDWLVGGEP